ncbi:inactive ubiquitin carboxyl-terminal hydrolase MINDY-4B-like [Procambarus clarkii]|uniref:inactive ubiquitin carboxyl-terminal hydrolase MINDY-4B-like n=1 Tax=Procambarus clarkii TaxID=6728 RepID=UPI001E6732B8|nr:inactive ubiquitin carboxyl-terminal hydrolase MINDY-4B-like [Procambarus clarkii]
MANAAGFQDSVKKVLNARIASKKVVVPDPYEEEVHLQEVKNARRRSFQKLVKKVVHTQTTIRTVDHRAHAKHVLYPSRCRVTITKVPVVGGDPITPDTAIELRERVFGAADLLTFSLNEWLGQSFCFHDAGTALAYGLKAPKSSTKGLVMCVQAYVLKHLLFNSHKPGAVGDVIRLLRTTKKAQVDALVGALSDILWKAGERKHAVLCLTRDEVHVSDDPCYMEDGCTEKIVIFNYGKYEELKFNIRKYLYEMVNEDGNGILLFLYSLVLSRTFHRLSEDRCGEDQSLILGNGMIQPCLATLVITGRATLYLHNGIIYEGTEETMAKPKTGILIRAEIGLLVWRRPEGNSQEVVGSRLKTPSFPIWVTRCNDSYGILFYTSRDLLRDYHAENRFDLYYYSSSTSQIAATILSIDTRVRPRRDDQQIPPLENLIHTKWQDADVSWNGTTPYV